MTLALTAAPAAATCAEYDCRCDGTPPPAATLALITTPAALLARVKVREWIAAQDAAVPDSHAYHRNMHVAMQMRERAEENAS